VTAKDGNGRTLLHFAGSKDVVEFLIAKGVDVNAKTNEGGTPLHYAARDGRRNAAELLITRGANVKAKDNDGLTPLDYAARDGKQSIS